MLELKRQIRSLNQSGFFDGNWYLTTYPTVAAAGISPAEHYLKYGWLLGYSPSPRFSTKDYLRAHPDVAELGVNPLLHYLEIGIVERRPRAPLDDGVATVTAASREFPIDPEPSRLILPLGGSASPRDGKTVLVVADSVGASHLGNEQTPFNVQEGLFNLGYNVVAVIPRGTDDEHIARVAQTSTDVMVAPVEWWREARPADEASIAAFAHVVADFAIDLVHVNTAAMREPLLAADRLGVESVLHIHETSKDDLDPSATTGERAQDIARSVDATDNVIGGSEAILRSFPGATRSFVVHDYVGVRGLDTVATGRFADMEESQDAALRRRGGSDVNWDAYLQQLGSVYEAIVAEATPREMRERLTLPARADLVTAPPAERRPLRIAYFLWQFPVLSETFVVNELRILVEQGHDVQVFCRHANEGVHLDFPISWEAVASPEELAARLIETEREIVHSHFVYPTVTKMLWPACEIAGVPFTFIAHAIDIFRFKNDEVNQIGAVAASEWCRTVFVPSEFHRRFVVSRGVPVEKTCVNPNGIDPELYGAAADQRPGRELSFTVCAVHRFTEKKGLESLIRAAKVLASDGIEFHIYGYGPLEAQFRSVIEAEGISNVELRGALSSRAELLEVFAEHDLFACPSVRASDGDMDGIPTVLMEAMAAGLPVLTTSLSGIPDLVQDGVTGWISEPDPMSVARAIREFYSRPSGRVAAVAGAAKRRIAGGFNVRDLTEVLLRVWRNERFDVVIVTWNNLSELVEVVERLLRYTDTPFHLIVFDNNSSLSVLAYLSGLYARRSNVTLILNRDNVMVGPGTNVALEHGNSDYAFYFCAKEGFLVRRGWEREPLRYMQQNPNVGMGGSMAYSPKYLTGAMYPVGVPVFDKFRNQEFAAANPDRTFCHVQGGLFVLRREMYSEIGGFSLDVPHNHTDVEYSYFAESCGWSLSDVPGILAVYVKARPTLAELIDEGPAALHPPRLAELEVYDAIASASVNHCGICTWTGDSFTIAGSAELCPDCNSTEEDRATFKYFAGSTLLNRSLLAVGFAISPGLTKFWNRQFKGLKVADWNLDAAMAAIDVAEPSADLGLAYFGSKIPDGAGLASFIEGLAAKLADAGSIVFRAPPLPGGQRDEAYEAGVKAVMNDAGFKVSDQASYFSVVQRFDASAFTTFSR